MKLFRTPVFFFFASAAFMLGFAEPSSAIEIPLDGGVITTTGDKGAALSAPAGIAFVDIELIFNEHPMTARLKAEFEAEVDRRKRDFSVIESSIASVHEIIVSSQSEVNRLKKEIELVKTAIKEKDATPQTLMLPGTTNFFVLPISANANTVKADPAIIDADEKTISFLQENIDLLTAKQSELKRELEAAGKTNRADLVAMEDAHTQTVLKDVYKVLEKIASEEGLTIVVDKNNVLYGKASQDITEKVRDRMRGR